MVEFITCGRGTRANKICVVDLTEEERTFLTDFVNHGERSARQLKRAHILLLADEGKTDGEIAAALHTSTSTVQHTRQRWIRDGTTIMSNGIELRRILARLEEPATAGQLHESQRAGATVPVERDRDRRLITHETGLTQSVPAQQDFTGEGVQEKRATRPARPMPSSSLNVTVPVWSRTVSAR